jgi:hypothetical protein
MSSDIAAGIMVIQPRKQGLMVRVQNSAQQAEVRD